MQPTPTHDRASNAAPRTAAPSDVATGDAAVGDDGFMLLALDAAARAGDAGEVPVGAVVVVGGEVVATAANRREELADPTAHAEILALRAASEKLGRWRLDDATLYVTLEPCPMCAGALVASRLARVVFGATDPKAGSCGSLYNLCADPRLNHELPVTPGVKGQECGELLTNWFAERRGQGATG